MTSKKDCRQLESLCGSLIENGGLWKSGTTLSLKTGPAVPFRIKYSGHILPLRCHGLVRWFWWKMRPEGGAINGLEVKCFSLSSWVAPGSRWSGWSVDLMCKQPIVAHAAGSSYFKTYLHWSTFSRFFLLSPAYTELASNSLTEHGLQKHWPINGLFLVLCFIFVSFL